MKEGFPSAVKNISSVIGMFIQHAQDEGKTSVYRKEFWVPRVPPLKPSERLLRGALCPLPAAPSGRGRDWQSGAPAFSARTLSACGVSGVWFELQFSQNSAELNVT